MHSCILILRKRKTRKTIGDADTIFEWMSMNGSGCDYVKDNLLTEDEKPDCFHSLEHFGTISGEKIKFDEKKLEEHHNTMIKSIKDAANSLTYEKYIDWLGVWRMKHAIEPSYTYVYTKEAGVENLDEFLRRCTCEHSWTWYLEDVYDWHC